MAAPLSQRYENLSHGDSRIDRDGCILRVSRAARTQRLDRIACAHRLGF